ncbi:MAG: glucose 1-dehydrogenase [Hyphomicrobiales bacterium]|nr:glucose 1-dehydrogenase [Hyphomicrobiales bacterium]
MTDALARFRLEGKTAVVTGGARGIGYATAELMAAAGADIALVDILEEPGQESAERLRASGRKVTFHQADLTDPAASTSVCAEVTDAHRPAGILVNCIGICPNTDVLDIPPAEWREVMDVNVNAQFFVAQAFARTMVDNGGGSIVSIGSNSGFTVDRPQPQAHYNASKAAVHQMVRSLAAELAPQNVRVNAVAPGYTLTEMTKRGLGKREWVDIWQDMTPMQRFAEPEEIAHAVLYLASDAASYVTGTVLLVDGGYSCW